MGVFHQKRKLKAKKMMRRVAGTRARLIWMKMFLSIALSVFFCWAGLKILKLPQWYIDYNKLNRADSEVLVIQGNIITPKHKIVNIIRQTRLPYTQIFRLNTKELEQNIIQLQTVKNVYIRRVWFPARLIIVIEERTPAFLLMPNPQTEPNSALTTDGVLIDHDYLPFDPSVKTVKLLTYGVRDGVDEVWDKKRVENILKIVKLAEMYSNEQVQYIDLRNNSDVYIMLEKYPIRFGQINDTSIKRLKSIASILPEAKKINQKIKYIDLRWEDSYYFRLEGEKEINTNNNPSEELNQNDIQAKKTTENQNNENLD